MRKELENSLYSNEKLADYLQEEFSKGFDDIVKRIWPEISYISYSGGGSSKIYGEKLKQKYCSSVKLYSSFYEPVQGIIGFNLRPQSEKEEYLLLPSAGFFEFIPVEDITKNKPRTYFPDQVSNKYLIFVQQKRSKASHIYDYMFI